MDDPVLLAVRWLDQLVAGSLASVIAALVVAAFGFRMLTGRADWRRGTSIIIGCFVIFGAAQISAGLVAWHADARPVAAEALPPRIEFPVPQSNFDPYAGAAPVLKPVSKAEAARESGKP